MESRSPTYSDEFGNNAPAAMARIGGGAAATALDAITAGCGCITGGGTAISQTTQIYILRSKIGVLVYELHVQLCAYNHCI